MPESVSYKIRTPNDFMKHRLEYFKKNQEQIAEMKNKHGTRQ